MNRKNDNKFMDYAIQLSNKANCIKGKVGAIIVKDDDIISEGVNSVPNGLNPCTEETCIRKILKLKSGENQELCFVVHAEQNALIDALNKKKNIKGSTLYVTKQPCIICAKMLINCRIKEIVYLKEYPDRYSNELLKKAKIISRKYEE
jgi:dCMP deaminase